MREDNRSDDQDQIFIKYTRTQGPEVHIAYKERTYFLTPRGWARLARLAESLFY